MPTRDAARARRRYLLYAVSFSAALSLVLLVVVAAWISRERARTSQAICLAQVQNRDALRLMVLRLREFTYQSRTLTMAEKHQRDRIYVTLLGTIPELRCEDGNPVEET